MKEKNTTQRERQKQSDMNPMEDTLCTTFYQPHKRQDERPSKYHEVSLLIPTLAVLVCIPRSMLAALVILNIGFILSLAPPTLKSSPAAIASTI